MKVPYASGTRCPSARTREAGSGSAPHHAHRVDRARIAAGHDPACCVRQGAKGGRRGIRHRSAGASSVVRIRLALRSSVGSQMRSRSSVSSWQPIATLIVPGERYWHLFEQLCQGARAVGNLREDAWFAALAIEAGCKWITHDRDYARFDGFGVHLGERRRRPPAAPSAVFAAESPETAGTASKLPPSARCNCMRFVRCRPRTRMTLASVSSWPVCNSRIPQDLVIGPSPRDQCASAVCSTDSFHGLIFASVFARLAFATSVS